MTASSRFRSSGMLSTSGQATTTVFGWRRSANRRQVGAFLALTPRPCQSGSSNREQGITKAGPRQIRGLGSSSPGYGCAINRAVLWLNGTRSASGMRGLECDGLGSWHLPAGS